MIHFMTNFGMNNKFKHSIISKLLFKQKSDFKAIQFHLEMISYAVQTEKDLYSFLSGYGRRNIQINLV